VCGLLSVGAWRADAQAVGYTVSVNGARGAYPGQRVDSFYLFNSVDVAAGPFRLAATVPWMRTETTASEVPAVTDPALPSTATGFADPLVRIDLRVLDDPSRELQIGVAAGLKIPVVSASSGRGTGEADYAIGSNVFKAVHRTTFIADVLFWKYGDPEGVEFTDAWSYAVGAGQIFGHGRWSAIGSVAGFSAGVAGMPAPVTLNGGLMRLVGSDQSLGIAVSVGLNDGSNDLSIATTWRIAHR
jgi:hypothetical protein